MSGEVVKTETIGIIITHGDLAEVLKRTVELIVGTVEGVYPLSGSDLCNEDIIGEIRKLITDDGKRRAILFVDYFGGSCCINSVRAVEGVPGVKVISGVNLPVLLDFVTKRGTMDFDTMVDHLIRRGRESVRVIDF
ncbi:MAG: hypothetical protein JSV33_12845 [bacterium]|nr:MAG: hypothetical protein JSV33_12845 [bacterium]